MRLRTKPANWRSRFLISLFSIGLTYLSCESLLEDKPEVAIGSIKPATATLLTGFSRTFYLDSLKVTGNSSSDVEWSIQEGPAGGTIIKQSLYPTHAIYTAPETPGTYHVIVTSVADRSKRASATVTVRFSLAGVFRSTNNGESWTQGELHLLPIYCLAVNSSGHIFAGSEVGGIYRSLDNGNSWARVNSGLTTKNVQCLAISTNGLIFAGTSPEGGIYRSSDNGNNWTQINTGLINDIFGMPEDIRSLAINSSGDVFAGTYLGGAYRSTNNGNNWTRIGNGLPTNTSVYSLAAHLDGYVFAGTVSGVYRSTDNGNNWMKMNTGLTSTDVRSFAINPIGHLFVGITEELFAGGGIYRSTNNGNNWTKTNTGLTNTDIRSLAIYSTGHVFAGTWDVAY